VILGGKNLFSQYKRKNRENQTRKQNKKIQNPKSKIQNFPICPRDFPRKNPTLKLGLRKMPPTAGHFPEL
jgi:hypothetical protein